MNNIQDLISNWKFQVALLKNKRSESKIPLKRTIYLATYQQLERCIAEAELLLSNKPTEAITGSAHSANTLLGERAASESDQSIGGGGAEHSETAIVRQNEQTKELCDRCGTEMYTRGIYIKCPSCDHW